MVKRPLGLKASKLTKKSKPSTTINESQTTTEEENTNITFKSIGFKSKQEGKETEDELTISDLHELLIQSKENLIKFNLFESLNHGNESCNLLRGICHECYRRINLKSITLNNENQEKESIEVDELIFPFLAWSSFYLGLLIYPINNPPNEKLIQLDEPNELKRWCWISLKSLESEPENHQDFNQFKLLKPTILLIQVLLESENEKQESSFEILKNWNENLTEELSRLDISEFDLIWLISSSLKIIESISPNWNDVFLNQIGSSNLFNLIKNLLESFIIKLDTISNEFDDQDLIKLLKYSVLFHLSQRSLLHGSSLAESIEDKYFPEEEDDDEEQEKEEEGFAIDINDPVYKDTLNVLHLAEASFIKAIEMVENNTSLKDTKQEIIKDLNVQLSETLLTLGNMLEPGEEQEKVYKRASELSGVVI